jgi:predicted amidophosphoribosyltransferase
MPFCLECGKPIAAKAKFCRNCGASQAEEVSEPAGVPAPAAAPVAAPVSSQAPAPVPVPKPAENLCRTCNSPLAFGEKFCGSCGAKTGDAPLPPPPAAPVPAAPANACPSCKTPLAPGTKFCGSCGTVIGLAPAVPAAPVYAAPAPQPAAAPGSVRLCTACGNPIKPGDKYCSKCLVMVKDNAPAAAPVSAPAPVAAVPLVQPVPAPMAAAPGSVRLCTACGNPIKPGDKYCSKCLVIVKDNQPAPLPTPPATVAAPSPAPAHVVPAPAVQPASAAAPGSVRLCTACGNPIKPGDKYCSKCLVIVKDPVAVSPVPAPAGAPAPAAPGGYVCASCGSPLSGTEKFCGVCGGPAVAARPAAPAPAPAVPPGKVCGACGAPVSDTTKFCGGCGAPVGASFPAGPVVPQPVNPAQPGSEQVIGVIGNARKMKMLGAAWDTFTIMVTDRRMIIAQLTQENLNAAIAEAQAKAKAEGKGFFSIIADQMAVSFQYAKRYETMAPDAALAETPGNRAIGNDRITAVTMKLNAANQDSSGFSEFKMLIDSAEGRFEFMIGEDDRFISTLKGAYGEKVAMPFGYFRAGGARIKFF